MKEKKHANNNTDKKPASIAHKSVIFLCHYVKARNHKDMKSKKYTQATQFENPHNRLPETSGGILKKQERQEHNGVVTLFSVSMSCKIKTYFCHAQLD